MNDYYYLAHGGPGSGRYPLGSGDRPYQKFEGSGRRSSGGISGYIRARRAKKQEAEKIKQMKEKKAAEEAKRRHDADKEKVLRSGKASDVLKYQGELTNQELRDVITRLDFESNLRARSLKETTTALDKIDKIMQTVKTGTEWAQIGTKAYNTFASIYNATDDGKKKPLAIVNTNVGGGNNPPKKT